MTQAALRIVHLHKSFDHPAVNDLNLHIPKGIFYALLGPNGAGKTTSLRMVAGLLAPDSGSITVCGHDMLRDPQAAKRCLAWIPDEPMLYDRLTPYEYLEFIGALWGMEPAHAEAEARALIDRLGLSAQLHTRCEGLSKGMRQKVTLAAALLHNPELMILDEPLTGLDAASARVAKQLLTERVRQGTTIVMTTHILEVAERMAERIGILYEGRLVAEGSLAELQAQAGQQNSTLEDVFLSLASHDVAP